MSESGMRLFRYGENLRKEYVCGVRAGIVIDGVGYFAFSPERKAGVVMRGWQAARVMQEYYRQQQFIPDL